jgi:hypothetical protein
MLIDDPKKNKDPIQNQGYEGQLNFIYRRE